MKYPITTDLIEKCYNCKQCFLLPDSLEKFTFSIEWTSDFYMAFVFYKKKKKKRKLPELKNCFSLLLHFSFYRANFLQRVCFSKCFWQLKFSADLPFIMRNINILPLLKDHFLENAKISNEMQCHIHNFYKVFFFNFFFFLKIPRKSERQGR